ncbi:MAG: hypothetical protein ABW168_24915 [Sedimenticola sp.]
MIEGYFQKGAIITNFDFIDVRGTPLPEISVYIFQATADITETKIRKVLLRK